MKTTKREDVLISVFAHLAIGAIRKKVYARKAINEGQKGLSQLLHAMAESEKVQARRLMHALRGKIENSEKILAHNKLLLSCLFHVIRIITFINLHFTMTDDKNTIHQ